MRRFWLSSALILCVMLITLPPVAAQTVYNPRLVQFDSPDNALACPADGCIGAYTLEFWLQGVDPAVGQPVSVYQVPKAKVVPTGLAAPAPQLQVQFTDVTPVPAIPVGSTYVARMMAVSGIDPTIVSLRSDPSNPFASARAPRSLGNLQLK